MNKPIFAIGSGNIFNSGAAIFASTSNPYVTKTATVCFNEVTFGMTPHSGAIYHLSKLPDEIGTFLALTGMHIKA